MKKLIVNADDFGMCESMNKGIIYGFKNGIITSASLMVNRPAAQEAAQLAKDNPKLGIGLHFDFNDFPKEIIKIFKKIKTIEMAKEIDREIATPGVITKAKKIFEEQVRKFKELVGRTPDHLDGHYHIHKLPSFLPFVFGFAQRHGIPLRKVGSVRFIESFSTDDVQDASVENLTKILKNLPDGVSELMTHPVFCFKDLKKISSETDYWKVELKTLTSPEIENVIKEEKIELISWRSVSMI
jgi:predicted glycoside hydrolase/deacetylase ChbG (UPF0249 family)